MFGRRSKETMFIVIYVIQTVSSFAEIKDEEIKRNSELQDKLEGILGFENLDKIRNGNVHIVSSNIEFQQNFMTSIATKFLYPVLTFKNIRNLMQTADSVSRKGVEISLTRWIPHIVASILWLDNHEEEGIAREELRNIAGPTRRGDFVFIAKEKILMSLFEDDSVKSLKYKSGIILESNMIMSVPKVYLGKMLVTSHIPRRPKSVVNVHGRHIRISGSKMPPYCDVRVENGKKVFSGSNFAIIDSAANKFNFTYDLDAPRGKSPGTKLKNGTWTGMLADVYSGRADITIVNAYNVERFHVIDFTTSFTVTNLVFATSHAKKQVSLAAIVYPYNPLCWGLITIAFFSVMPFYAIFLWFNPYGFNRNWKDVLYKSIFIPYVLGIRQDFRIPQGLNFLSIHWMIFVIIIGIGYESNLVSYLSSPEPGFIPTNFIQLAAHSEFDVHFNIFSNIGRSLFQKGNSEMLKTLNKKFTSEASTVDCVVATFASEKAACVGWTDILYSAIGKNLTLTYGIEPLFISQHSLVNNWLAFGLRKDSEYTEAFSYIASSYGVTGLVQRWKDDIISYYRDIGRGWMSTQNGTELHRKLVQLAMGSHNDPKPFQIENVQISFVIFALGIFFSSFTFVGEHISNRGEHSILVNMHKCFYIFSFELRKIVRCIGNMNQHKSILLPPTASANPYGKFNHMYLSTIDYTERPRTTPTLKGSRLL